VLSQVEPGSIRSQLPRIRREAEHIEEMLRDIERIIVPGLTHWNHPAFFAYFAVTGSRPGILAVAERSLQC
jgi:aromatic-L-amino-acid decarboxylase